MRKQLWEIEKNLISISEDIYHSWVGSYEFAQQFNIYYQILNGTHPIFNIDSKEEQKE